MKKPAPKPPPKPPLATRICEVVEWEYPGLPHLEVCMQIGCALQAALLRLKHESEEQSDAC